jgi:hypothetical protein
LCATKYIYRSREDAKKKREEEEEGDPKKEDDEEENDKSNARPSKLSSEIEQARIKKLTFNMLSCINDEWFRREEAPCSENYDPIPQEEGKSAEDDDDVDMNVGVSKKRNAINRTNLQVYAFLFFSF